MVRTQPATVASLTAALLAGASGAAPAQGPNVFEPGTNFLRPNLPVPAAALTTEAGAPDLLAEVYVGRDVSGAPVETRTDPPFSITGEKELPR